MLKRIYAVIGSLMMLCFSAASAFAAGYEDSGEGTYYIDASLSCYINAMGGVEFGAPLLTSAQVEVKRDGSREMTLYFGKSNVTIYGVSCDTFVDAFPSYVTDTNGVKSGTLGFYEEDGTLNTEDVTYTLSEDTAENALQEQVHYVDSVTFPIGYESDTYMLSLFVNSNVMGTQFTVDGYTATLTVDWTSLTADKLPDDSEAVTGDSSDDAAEGNIESRDGLNIHRAEDETETDNVQAAAEGYTAYLKKPVFIAVGIVGGAMIILGASLAVLGKKEGKS